MKVRWTRLARSDLANTQAYISAFNPAAARKVGARIRDAVLRLESNPRLGRPGTIAGTREKLALPYPYIIVYEIAEHRNEIWVLRVYHMAQSRTTPDPEEEGSR